jgi:glutathione S-transferase
MAELTIWGGGTPRSFRPVWVAEELGLEYEHNPIGPRTGETKTEAYTELNPKQKIPYLQDGDFGMSESVAICRYLIEQYDQGQFYHPTDSLCRARQEEWVCHIYGEIDETSLYVMRRHRDLHEIYGEAPAAVESSKVYAERHFDIVAEYLANKAYMVGDAFGLADVMLMSCLDWAGFYGVSVQDNLVQYKTRIAERAAYQAAYQKNYPQLVAQLSQLTQQGD